MKVNLRRQHLRRVSVYLFLLFIFFIFSNSAFGQVCSTQSFSGPAVAIPDNTPSGVSRTVSFSENRPITDVNVTLDITHTWDGDLSISLTSPAGTVIDLSSGNGFFGDDYTNTVFDDAAGTAITAGLPPYTGTYSPEQALSSFNGENPNGTWTLTVVDGAGADTGTLNSFSVEVCIATTDLAVAKTVNNSTPNEGDTIIYSLSVTNNGTVQATNVSITDILPTGVTYASDDGAYVSGTGVWTIGTLNNGASTTLNITATVNAGTNGSSITNTITAISADQTDSNTTADDLSESITVSGTGGGVDQPPVVTASGNEYLCPGVGNSQNIATSISITDPDDTTTDAVYIQISSGYVNGEDILALSSPGSHPSITATFDATQGELSLQGPATFAEFEDAVLDVLYSSSNASATGTKQFSITPGTANYLPPTDHYYEFVTSPGISWTAANTAANARTYFGLQGYLATLTTQAEADFSGAQATGVGWIGANDVATEGDWRWVTGPEGLANGGTGTPFWSGNTGGTTVAPVNFAFWNPGLEPNNCCGGEDYAHITDITIGPVGSWNDLPNAGGSGAYASQGYVVEYGGTPGDPVLSISATTTINLTSISISSQPGDDSICAGDNSSFSVSASAPNQTLTYQWQVSTGGAFSDLSDGGIYSNVTTATLNITSASVTENNNQYRVVISSNVPGCGPLTSSAGTLTVDVLDDATFNYNAAAYCADASDPTPTITGLTGGTFSSTAGLSIDGSTGVIDLSASTPATYAVTYTTSGTCPNSSNINVTINVVPSAPIVSTPVEYCVGDTASALTATGTNLLWYTVSSGGTGSSTAPTPSTVSAGSTSYYVSQTNGAGCESARSEIEVEVFAPVNIFCERYRIRDASNVWGPWIAFTGGSCTIPLCDDGGFQDIQFDGGPNINTGWVWTDEDGNVDSEVDEIVRFDNIGMDDAGTYTGVYTSPDGCVSNISFDVVVNALPTAEAGPGSEINCNNLTITLDGTGTTIAGVTYLWSGGTIDSGGTTLSPVVSAAGVYTLTVTNTTTGCVATDTVTITEDILAPTADAGAPAELTCAVTTLV
ncbi:proprotein convertase P-domain-containing protein, partial [uncultured Algibacter sp.]|uniref:proprotein convertase P-domain-containing protein n=1 Tax=uncultured Algibacter sp. TaxID=298659 RepID=UPI002629A331